MLSSIQHDNLNSPKFNDHITNVIDEISFEHSSRRDLNFNSTPKNNKLINESSCTMRKVKNKTLSSMLKEDRRFSKKEIPPSMLSVDYIRRRRKTPEK